MNVPVKDIQKKIVEILDYELYAQMTPEDVEDAVNEVTTTEKFKRAILNDEKYQIVITDTPGIHKPKTKLGETMIDTAFTMTSEVDVVLFLIEATLDFPFVIDAFVFSTYEQGLKAVEKESDAYAELISRESGLESLLAYVEDRIIEQFPNKMSGAEEYHNEILSILILYQEKFQEELTEEDRKFVEAFSNITSE